MSTSTTTTSISSTTTTSTFVPGVCGNGVIDQPDEYCDLPDLGVCDDFPSLPIPFSCGAPTSSFPCSCCGATQCIFDVFGPIVSCCDGECQDTTGFGQVRGGWCIPPSCQEDADCNGYRCVDGTCCGDAGSLCGVAGCCPGSGTTCDFVPGAPGPSCCHPAGAPCSLFSDCCSGSCTGGSCD